MALLKTEIASLALGNLGSSAIIRNLDNDPGTVANVLRRWFPLTLRIVLQKYSWAFAYGESPLTLISEDLEGGNILGPYQFRYQFPSNAVKVRDVAMEGRFSKAELYEAHKEKFTEVQVNSSLEVWTDVPRAHARYTRSMSEDSSFPEHFSLALAAQWALYSGPQIVTGNFAGIQKQLKMIVAQQYSEAIAIEVNRTPTATESPTPFELARYRDVNYEDY